jgi:hypothetical protein
MTAMRRAWRAWVELLDRREPATALALVRMFVAIVLLADHVTIARLDLVDALWSPRPDGFAIASAWASPTVLWTIAVIALVCIAVGAATRVACVAFVVVSAQLSHVSPEAERGIDMLMRVVIVILALSRCNARWSVDAWVARRRGRAMPAEVPAWPRYLLLFQLVWVYFSGGTGKGGAAWTPQGGFTALANALADPHTGRFDPSWLATVYPLTRVATAVTITFELAAPLYLLAYYFAATAERAGRVRRRVNRSRARWIWIGTGIAFHVGIAVTMRLGIFAWGMLALYPVLLLPRELARLAPQRRNTEAPANRASSPS